MYTRQTTPRNVTSLRQNEIFVFGSNLGGIHNGGAALAALRFGACVGKGVGIQGQSYAIPTVGVAVARIPLYVNDFIDYAIAHPDKQFLVTRIGCGSGGFTDGVIAPLFMRAVNVSNITLPVEFARVLNKLILSRVAGRQRPDLN